MKKVCLLLVFCMLLGLCSCGKEVGQDDAELPVTEQSAEPSGQPQVTVIQSPAGFSERMVINAGFVLGVQTPENIVAMFGEPESININTYSAGEIVRYEYPFGAFEFDGTLYYIEAFEGVTGPQGLAVGMSLNETVELFCAGSSALLDGSGEVMLYGAEDGDYGEFCRLTEEFVGDYGVYQIDYRAVTPSGKLKLTVNLDQSMTVTAFTLQLS